MEKEKIEALLGLQKDEADYINNQKVDEIPKHNFFGDAKSDKELNDLMDNRKPLIISVIGFPECGKSTFVSSIYYLCLTRGGIKQYKFYNSDTLIGFEKRSFIRQITTETENRNFRTQVYENSFLSLYFKNDEGKNVKIILSDRSGETYQKYKDKAGLSAHDVGLCYADIIILLVDSNEFISHNVNEKKRLRCLISRLKEEGIFKPNTKFYLVMNKTDLCSHEEIESKINDFLEKNKELFPESYDVKHIQSINLRGSNALEEFVSSLIEIKFKEELSHDIEDIDWVRILINNFQNV